MASFGLAMVPMDGETSSMWEPMSNFEDLGTLPQLPGVGPQRFPSEYGWGFSAEGDWKTSCLLYTSRCV